MAAEGRTVRRLRLRAQNEAAVRRTATVVEDALRTASLPDGGGRMLFVRRLDLGRIDSRAAPTLVALAVERAVERLGVEWRHGGETGANEAPAVWFRDPLDAHLALARRVLSGPPPDEWYWPRAVPGWNRSAPQGEGLREIALSLATLPEAPVALPLWFDELVRAGYREALRSALREEDVPQLTRAAGVVLLDPGEITRVGPTMPVDSRAPWPGDLDRSLRSQPAPLRVQSLIATMVRASEAAAPATTSRRMERAADLQPATSHPAGRGNAPRRRRAGGSPHPVALPGARWTPSSEEPRLSTTPPDPTLGAAASIAPYVWGAPSLPTSAGGLLFLLNGLTRIGYGEWRSRQPEWERHDIARRVLAGVLTRLRVAQSDPAWVLAAAGTPSVRSPERFVAPGSWRDGLLRGDGPLRLTSRLTRGDPADHGDRAGQARRSNYLHDPAGRLLLGAWRGACPRPLVGERRRAIERVSEPTSVASSRRTADSLDNLAADVVFAWETALRRWLRRYAHVGIADLVLRPGGLAATPTHLDVNLDLEMADPRIRRAGLDFDPGWLPWFGRVIGFHYERAGGS